MAQEHDEVRELAKALEGKTLLTLSRGQSNKILSVHATNGIMVRARSDARITWDMVDSVIDVLLTRHEVRRDEMKQDRVPGRFRSAFIFALLTKTSFAVFHDGALQLRDEKVSVTPEWGAIQEHRAAVLRRRIKYVVELGAMARLFQKGQHKALQSALARLLLPATIANIHTRAEYDHWIVSLVRLPLWRRFSRNGLKADRWAYFAKLINIIIYDVTSNRELFDEQDWLRVRDWLHVPLDSYVLKGAREVCGELRAGSLQGITQNEYLNIQRALREGARRLKRPAIWFEDAYAPMTD